MRIPISPDPDPATRSAETRAARTPDPARACARLCPPRRAKALALPFNPPHDCAKVCMATSPDVEHTVRLLLPVLVLRAHVSGQEHLHWQQP